MAPETAELGHRRRQEGEAPAEAEAHREQPPRPERLERRRSGGHVGAQAGVRRERDVGHRLERRSAVVVSRGPPEIVDGEGVDARACETDSELFVVPMEPANVGQDEHRGLGRRRIRTGAEGDEPIAIGRRQVQALGVDGAAGDGRDRWLGILVEAHVVDSRSAQRGDEPHHRQPGGEGVGDRVRQGR